MFFKRPVLENFLLPAKRKIFEKKLQTLAIRSSMWKAHDEWEELGRI
jgi:hypothetical protein